MSEVLYSAVVVHGDESYGLRVDGITPSDFTEFAKGNPEAIEHVWSILRHMHPQILARVALNEVSIRLIPAHQDDLVVYG